MKESDACHYLIFYYNQKVLFVKEVNWKYFLLGASQTPKLYDHPGAKKTCGNILDI
jgi:hypothetical protein